MANGNKQLAIIDRIKYLVKKTGSSIFGSGRDNSISEEVARKIQKKDYEQTHKIKRVSYTPPYMAVAEQLKIEDAQIFKAAVFNLASIAINEKSAAAEILAILEKNAQHGSRDKEQITYALKKIDEIKRKHRMF